MTPSKKYMQFNMLTTHRPPPTNILQINIIIKLVRRKWQRQLSRPCAIDYPSTHLHIYSQLQHTTTMKKLGTQLQPTNTLSPKLLRAVLKLPRKTDQTSQLKTGESSQLLSKPRISLPKNCQTRHNILSSWTS